MTLLMPLWVALMGGCVNETGYEQPDDSGLEVDDGGPEVPGNDHDADVLGDRLGSEVFYTADAPLGSLPTDVTFVALPGAFEGDSVGLQVVGRASRVGVDLVEGGFVTVSRAALGDEIRIYVTDETYGTLVLADDLTSVTPPTGGGVPGDTGTDAGAALEPGFESFGATAGSLAVGDGQIAGFEAPYLVYDVQLGTAARVAVGQTDVVLTVQGGDTVCVAPLDTMGRTGVAGCTTLAGP